MIYKEYKSSVEDIDAKGRVLVAANAIGNTDSDGDISMKGSFNETLKKDFNRLKWFLNHDTSILLGVPIEGKEEDNYLKMLGQLNMAKQVSRDIYEDYKLMAEHGRTLEHSIGVKAVERNKSNTAQVLKWQLFEYSTLTHWGSNSDTPMLGIKSRSMVELDAIQERIEWMELQLTKGNFSDEKCRKIEIKLKDLLKIVSDKNIGNTDGEEANPLSREIVPTTQNVHQVEPVAFDPARFKAAADAFALRSFLNLNKAV